MQANQQTNQLCARILHAFDAVLLASKPWVVLVHGDTTTSTMCALAAFHRGIKVGHVEAGLRTYDKHAPFPEEMNRQLTGRIADFHFAPTVTAANHLRQEGVKDAFITVTGNTVIDALYLGLQKLSDGYQHTAIAALSPQLDPSRRLVVVTGHRRENFGDGFTDICKALNILANQGNVQVVYPVHPNPNVQQPVREWLAGNKNILLIEPLDYPAFIWLMQRADVILTDSGGVQEEAPSLGKPVLVMRDVSERPEAIAAGLAELVGTNTERIVTRVNAHLQMQGLAMPAASSIQNPYGDGKACDRIISYLHEVAHRL
jgi:UDP-N-acetylglucosamine 2-epimerase (non-hydrolysing)